MPSFLNAFPSPAALFDISVYVTNDMGLNLILNSEYTSTSEATHMYINYNIPKYE